MCCWPTLAPMYQGGQKSLECCVGKLWVTHCVNLFTSLALAGANESSESGGK